MHFLRIIFLHIIFGQISSQSLEFNDEIVTSVFFNSEDSSLIVACKNRLYRVNTYSFQIDKSLRIGPTRETTSQCNFYMYTSRCVERAQCGTNETQIDNRVYFMLNYSDEDFLECGSSYEGSCRLRNKKTLYASGCNFTQPIVWYNAGGSGVLSTHSNSLFLMTNVRTLDRDLYTLEDLSLVNVFKIENGIFTTNSPYGTYLNIDKNKISSQIESVYSFKSNGFVYFLFNYDEQAKLVRICDLNSTEFTSSIIEVSFVCGKNTTKHVKSAHFSSELNTLFMSFNENLCSIQLSSLNTVINTALTSCTHLFNDSLAMTCLSTTNGIISSTTQTCRCSSLRAIFNKSKVNFGHNFCYVRSQETSVSEASSDLTYFSVKNPLQLEIIEKHNVKINSLVSTFLNYNRNLVILGLENGQIQFYDAKLNLFTRLMSFQTKQTPTHLAYDHKNHVLFVQSKTSLQRINLLDCSAYETCSMCLKSLSPYCGWCIFENKCIPKSECIHGQWLQSVNSSLCPQIINIQPKYLSPLEANSIRVRVNFELNDVLQVICVINGTREVHAQISASRNEAVCEVNTIDHDQNDYTIISIELKSNLTKQKLGSSEEIYFLNCPKFNSCKKCLSSINSQLCSWSLNNGKCQFLSLANDLSDAKKCPQFNTSQIINIALSQTSLNHEITLVNLDQIRKFPLICILNDTYMAPFKYKSLNHGYCQYSPQNDSQLKQTKHQFVHLKLGYVSENDQINEIDFVDFPLKKVYINVISCELSALNCGECLTNDLLRIECGWCSTKSICITQNECKNDFLAFDAAKNQLPLCPSPQITSISPSCGPIEGGTQLVINGINLGHSSSDVSVSLRSSLVTVGCRIVDYVKSSRIVCKTSSVSREANVTVLVSIGSDWNTVEVTSSFHYAQPIVTSISPTRAIIAGGSLITIYGKNLNCGSSKTIYFGLNLCDIVDESNSNEISCKTRPTLVSNKLNLRLTMDNFDTTREDRGIDFVENPIVDGFSLTKTILNGGLSLNVVGTSFDLIQRVIMNFSNEQEDISIICKIQSSTTIECPTPKFTHISIYKINLQLDGMNVSNDNSFINVHQDPIFNETRIFRNNEKKLFIEIKGIDLLLGLDKHDYRVVINNDEDKCKLIDIHMNYLTCELLLNESYLIARKRRDLFITNEMDTTNSLEIQVRVGATFVRTVGYLKYDGKSFERMESARRQQQPSFTLIIIIICSICGVLLVLMIASFVLLKIRQDKSKKELKSMQIEFENLEMEVAHECKEAFTELQTDIDEFRSTLDQLGPPFNDFSTYVMHILFPKASENEKSMLTSCSDTHIDTLLKNNVKNGLYELKQFLLNKDYLCKLIDLLAPEFTLNDRVYFASYLTICLHDHMAYFTEILMILSANLIEKSIQDKSIRMLFRRNESIAEKLVSYWFAFLLYDHIKESAGRPLYILFNCIKQQIYKGPVDALTCEAKYSLNQDKLIRQTITYEQMTIRVQIQFNDEQYQEIHVKLLNCDTISQCKEKILDSYFKGHPYSQRPHLDEFELAYVPLKINLSSITGLVVLHDDERNSTSDRLNTLATYKITNGSLLRLYHRQNSNYTYGVSNESNSYSNLDLIKNAENMTLLSKSSKSSSGSPPTYSLAGDMNTNTTFVSTYDITSSKHQQQHMQQQQQQQQVQHRPKKFHLIKPIDSMQANTKLDQTKLVSEIYLTRLLATKGGVQSCIDDFFENVFSTTYNTCTLPHSIKYFFDFLDDQANAHSINDDHVYLWKTNSLPLRFWTNIIQNPQFIFDIDKSQVVDSSLSIIAATFMDSCSQSSNELTIDSPASKLLFFKDVQKYRKWVQSYYGEIREAKRVPNDVMHNYLNDESTKHSNNFNITYALYKLFNDYVKKNFTCMQDAIKRETTNAKFNREFINKLHSILLQMNSIEI